MSSMSRAVVVAGANDALGSVLPLELGVGPHSTHEATVWRICSWKSSFELPFVGGVFVAPLGGERHGVVAMVADEALALGELVGASSSCVMSSMC